MARNTENTATPEWVLRREYGSQRLLRWMARLSLFIGRGPSRILLYPIAGYFLLFSRATRTASRDYLARVLEHSPSWGMIYHHILSFSSVIHDRFYLVNQRYDLFDIEVHGAQYLPDSSEPETAVFLFGAHLGSFEALRCLGQQRAGFALAMAMYQDNAQKINALLSALNPGMEPDIVALGGIDSMLRLSDRLEQGVSIGMLADRSLDQDNLMSQRFLGTPATFPSGPFRLAALLRRRVVFMAGLYLGANRYAIHFEPLADFSACAPGQREVAIHQAVGRYVMLLEQYCRLAPYNWFNFFDFWQASDVRAFNGQAQAPRD